MPKCKVSIIGAGSFLAKNIIEVIVGEEVELTLFGQTKPIKENVNSHFVKFQYPIVDLDFKLLLASDCVIFCAGAGIQAKHIVSTDLIYQVNTELPIKIVNYLSENGFRGKLISFGSYFEIGSNSAIKYFSEHELSISTLQIPSHYCASKRLLTRQFVNSLHQVKWCHLILPTIYGSGEDSNRLIPYLLNAMKRGDRVELTNGNQIRQYLHVSDVAAFVKEHILYGDLDEGIFNLAPKDYTKISDLVQQICDMKKFSISNFHLISRSDEKMAVLLLDQSKVVDQTGWQPSVSLLEGVLAYTT